MEQRYVLVADEQIGNVNYVIQHLLNLGHRVETAERGSSAFSAIVRRRAAGNPYDLVILDLHLPQMDALAIARDLRGRGDQTPLIIHASGARSDLGLARTLAGLRLISIHDRPLDAITVSNELHSLAPARTNSLKKTPQQSLAGTGETFFGTAQVKRPSTDGSGTSTYRAGEASPLPDEPALERRSPLAESMRTPFPTVPIGQMPRASGPGMPVDLHGGVRPVSTSTYRQPQPVDPPSGATGRITGASYRTPGPIHPGTSVTSRVRRSVTGSVQAPPPGAPVVDHTANASRTVACAYCNSHFQVPLKNERFVIVCVHCGRPNRIDPPG